MSHVASTTHLQSMNGGYLSQFEYLLVESIVQGKIVEFEQTK